MNTKSPTHDAITQRAHEIWKGRGTPAGHDTEIWLEAERQLSSPTPTVNIPSVSEGRGNGNSQASKTSADPKPADLKPGVPEQTKRLRGQMASASEVEHQITPAIPDDDAIKAALQVREARAPILAGKNAPHAKPTESGKPLWSKPHSS